MRLEVAECSFVVRKDTENEVLEGGAKRDRDPATRRGIPLDMFLLVDESGKPLPSAKTDRSLPFRAYYARKPCLAAVKAYYALIRQMQPPTHPLSDEGFDAIEMNAKKVATDEEVKIYMEKVRKTSAEPPAAIRLRRPHENKTREYWVSYQRVLKPNTHEVLKGITKVAVAKPR
jgi:hypothetical protein